MIDLPEHPMPRDAEPALVDFGATLQPALGGPVQRINRMGSRFRVAVTMPPMPSGKLGRQWVARLVRGKSEGVRLPFLQPDFSPGSPGTPIVSGSGQTGSSLVISGAAPNYAFREGQFFSILTGGKHHLYMAAEETLADASGNAALPVAPMLRRPHLDGDECHFAEPMIEGLVQGDEFAWGLALERVTQLQFVIVESQ